MKILFNKYEGTGNDFIIINNADSIICHDDSSLISKLCDRHFGIGADGLILIEERKGFDFEMVFFNSDGFPANMCGNGGRCASDFVMRTISGRGEVTFMAADGPHKAVTASSGIDLTINDVKGIKVTGDGIFLNTGVPHLVSFRDETDNIDIISEARPIRFSPVYGQEGTNVNFAMLTPSGLKVRTYERGVEDETLSCGTGVTASAIAAYASGKVSTPDMNVSVKGGQLNVRFAFSGDSATGIHLTGPATYVFSGEIET